MGIKHFVDMFGLSSLSKLSSKHFMAAFKNTLVLSIVKLFLNTFMAVAISLLLNEMRQIHFKKTVQTIIYLPHFMSWVVVASIFKMMLSASDSGMINQMLMNIGLISKPIEFLTSESAWRGVYYMVNIWKDTGWGTILFWQHCPASALIYMRRRRSTALTALTECAISLCLRWQIPLLPYLS